MWGVVLLRGHRDPLQPLRGFLPRPPEADLRPAGKARACLRDFGSALHMVLESPPSVTLARDTSPAGAGEEIGDRPPPPRGLGTSPAGAGEAAGVAGGWVGVIMRIGWALWFCGGREEVRPPYTRARARFVRTGADGKRVLALD